MTNEQIILAVLGVVLMIPLTVTGFFAKEAVKSINAARIDISNVRLELAKLIASHDATDERSRKNDIEISKHRERLHKLEGGQVTVLSYLKEIDN